MATMRFQARINQPVDAVWKAISVPDTIVKWFPGMLSSKTENNVRTVTGTSEAGSSEIRDIIITNDDRLKRFQYHVDQAEGHLATVDVFELGPKDVLVTYSVELASQELADMWGPFIEAGVKGLKTYFDGA
jgi:carbon monoxide dehydrogenase subunit G